MRIKFFQRGSGLILLLAAVAFLSTGCAFTRTKVSVNFQPSVAQPLLEGAVSQLAVGEVKDTRPVSDKFVLSQKYNAYGEKTSGAYVTEKPVGEIYRDGLMQALGKNGFCSSNAATKLELTANIQEFELSVTSGMWKATVQPRLTVRFELLDASGMPVWHDTMIGRGTLKTAWGNSEFLVQTFCVAANDSIDQLLADKSFRIFVSGKAGNPQSTK